MRLFEEFTNSVIEKGTKGKDITETQKRIMKLGFKLPKYGADGQLGDETIQQVNRMFNIIEKMPYVNKYHSDTSNEFLFKDNIEKIKELSEDDTAVKKIKSFLNTLKAKIKKHDIIGEEEIHNNIEDPSKFIAKLKEVSKKLGINYNWLAGVMWKESRFNPKAVNKDAAASGLIQFMPNTAKGLGTTIQAIRNMDAVEQLDYVYKFFKPYKSKLKDFTDLYLTTFYPYALNKGDDYILGSHVSTKRANLIALQNKGIDLNKDKKITKKEFEEYVWKGMNPEWISKLKKKA